MHRGQIWFECRSNGLHGERSLEYLPFVHVEQSFPLWPRLTRLLITGCPGRCAGGAARRSAGT
jgi:hypothetical protein